MINFKGNPAHKFAESPLLQLSLPPWRSRLMALLILGSFSVLIGRTFYLPVSYTHLDCDPQAVAEGGATKDRRLLRCV